MEYLIDQLIRVPVISVRYFCLIKDVLCDINQMFTYSCLYLYFHYKVFWQRSLEKPLLFPQNFIYSVIFWFEMTLENFLQIIYSNIFYKLIVNKPNVLHQGVIHFLDKDIIMKTKLYAWTSSLSRTEQNQWEA